MFKLKFGEFFKICNDVLSKAFFNSNFQFSVEHIDGLMQDCSNSIANTGVTVVLC